MDRQNKQTPARVLKRHHAKTSDSVSVHRPTGLREFARATAKNDGHPARAAAQQWLATKGIRGSAGAEILWVLTWVAITVAVVVAMTVGGLALYRYTAPREEAIRRQTWEQSRAKRQGDLNDLERLEVEWETAATPQARAVIAAVVQRRAAEVDRDSLPPDVNAFIDQVTR